MGIPMEDNTPETLQMLLHVREQLRQIIQDSVKHLQHLDEDYERDVQVAKSVMVARKIVRLCADEAVKLYNHGLLDNHVKDELLEYLLHREALLVLYGIGLSLLK